MPRTHVPVLAGELIEALDPQPRPDRRSTARSARAVTRGSSPTASARPGTLIAIDRDPLAEDAFAELAAEVACTTRFVRADFAHGLRS